MFVIVVLWRLNRGQVLIWYNDVNLTILDSNKTLLTDILLDSLAYTPMATLVLIISRDAMGKMRGA